MKISITLSLVLSPLNRVLVLVSIESLSCVVRKQANPVEGRLDDVEEAAFADRELIVVGLDIL